MSEETDNRFARVVDAVTESYRRGREIDALESAALPNKKNVAAALRRLEHVIYMGCYSTRELTEDNLHEKIEGHLREAYERLVEQVARAGAYRHAPGREPTAACRKWSEEVVLSVFERLPTLRELAALDVQAAYDGDPAAASIEEIIFSYPGVLAITIYRIAHEFFERSVPMIPRIMTEHAHERTGIDIHPGARIGKSFFIDHGTGVVIGETTVIGDNVKIYQGVTLGALSLPRDERGELIRTAKRHPTIEDGVTIYGGARILGGSTVIGAGSVVGGNVWLTESVPPNSKVVYTMPTGARHGQSVQTLQTVQLVGDDAKVG